VRIVLVGPPWCGARARRAKFIADHAGVPKISTGGHVSGRNIVGGTPLGVKAKGVHGRPASSSRTRVTIAMVRDRLAQPDAVGGFLLDGFPRNVAQAEELDRILAEGRRAGSRPPGAYVDLVLDLEGRPTTRSCHRISGPPGVPHRLQPRVSHVDYSPSANGDVCDICGGELYLRSDDDPGRGQAPPWRCTPQETAPIIGFYQAQGVLKTIDATGAVEEITPARPGGPGGLTAPGVRPLVSPAGDRLMGRSPAVFFWQRGGFVGDDAGMCAHDEDEEECDRVQDPRAVRPDAGGGASSSRGRWAMLKDAVRPGISTGELDRDGRGGRSARRGAVPSFLGYGNFPGSICASVNDEIVHGIPGARVLRDGDLISIDCGAIIPDERRPRLSTGRWSTKGLARRLGDHRPGRLGHRRAGGALAGHGALDVGRDRGP